MKILLINATNFHGSTGRNCFEIRSFINANGRDECRIAYAEGDSTIGDYEIGSFVERKIHGFLSRLTGRQGYYSWIGTTRLITYINQYKPDIINLNNIHANYLNYKMLMKYCSQEHIPVVLTLHDCWFYTGKCTHYTSVECFKWRSGCGNCPKLHSDNNSWFIDSTHGMWSRKKELFTGINKVGVIGVSKWITKEARESFLSDAGEIRCIYNWVDTKVFRYTNEYPAFLEAYGINPSKKIVLSVASRWGESKGLSKLIRLSKVLDDGYVFVVVGEVPSNYVFSKNMIHVKSTSSQSELAKIYSIANVFLTLSLEESFGKVTAEALSCGTPVICLDSTANRELIGPGCGEVLDPLSDEKDIANCIATICSKGKFVYLDICQQYAREHFEKKTQIEKYIHYFGELCKN